MRHLLAHWLGLHWLRTAAERDATEADLRRRLQSLADRLAAAERDLRDARGTAVELGGATARLHVLYDEERARRLRAESDLAAVAGGWRRGGRACA